MPLRHRPAGGGEPGGPVGTVAVVQQDGAGEIRRPGQRIFGGRDREQPLVEQHFGTDAMPGTDAIADGEVDPAAADLGERVLGDQLHIDAGLCGAKRAEPRQQPAAGERGQDAEAHRAPAGLEVGEAGAQPVQRLGDQAMERQSGFGRPDAARQPVEQRDAQVGLEERDASADRAMGEVHGLGGAAEAAEPDGGVEGAQGLGRRDALGHDL